MSESEPTGLPEKVIRREARRRGVDEVFLIALWHALHDDDPEAWAVHAAGVLRDALASYRQNPFVPTAGTEGAPLHNVYTAEFVNSFSREWCRLCGPGSGFPAKVERAYRKYLQIKEEQGADEEEDS